MRSGRLWIDLGGFSWVWVVCGLSIMPYISAYHYHLCSYQFMANTNVVKEVRLKVEVLDLSLQAFAKMKHF